MDLKKLNDTCVHDPFPTPFMDEVLDEGLPMVHARYFSVIVGHLYKMGNDEVLRRYVPKFEQIIILVDSHGGVAGGHYAGRETAQKILRVGLWCPTLHQDSKSYCKACDVCQIIIRSSWRDEMPLNPQVTLQPFEKWAIDFVGPIQPEGKTSTRYIVTTTKYLTRLEEAQLVKDCMGTTSVKFLFEHVLTRFGCPKILMRNHGTHFLNEMINALTEEFQVYHQKSTPYHP